MGELLRKTVVRTPLGPWLLAASERGPCFLGLEPTSSAAGLGAHAARYFGDARAVEDDAGLRAERERLASYAQGQAVEFDFELDLRGTAFQLEVWRALLAIPRGATGTYAQLARGLGHPGAARAVGGAAGANPLPVIVPCHRLLAASGLGGFSGGLELKRALLALEGSALGSLQNQLSFGA